MRTLLNRQNLPMHAPACSGHHGLNLGVLSDISAELPCSYIQHPSDTTFLAL